MTIQAKWIKMILNTTLKLRYRSTLGIISDILQACMNAGREGILISEISRKANLSHNAALQNCKRLVAAGFVRYTRTKRNSVFTITEKGIQFISEFQRFHDVAKELNIRY